MNKKDILDSKIKMLKNFLSPSNDDDEIKKSEDFQNKLDIVNEDFSDKKSNKLIKDVSVGENAYAYKSKK